MPRPPRPDLVVVCQVFHPELVSTGQTLTELVEELARMGLRVTVIAAQPTLLPNSKRVPSLIEHGGMLIRRTWSTRLPKASVAGKFLNLGTFFCSALWTVIWNYRGCQLLLLTNPPYLPFLGWVCNVLRGQKFGAILFDIPPENAELISFIRPNGLIAKCWRRFNRLWYSRANYAVVLSRDMIEGALKNANLLGTSQEAAARAKTHVIHVWADDRLIKPMPKSSSKAALRLGVLNKFVVQYSGNHGRVHDIETLVGIAKGFSPDEGVVFQFIGEGQKKGLVVEALKDGSLRHLYSESYVDKDLLPDSLSMADLGVVAQLPGQERVCYPSKLLGVMAAGRAALAVCDPKCEMAEMIRKHEIGFVVANGDVQGGIAALREAKRDPERLRRMGEAAHRLLREKFTLSEAARAYYDLIKSLRP